MKAKRASDEETRNHFRGDRYQCENGLWYFFTRENTLEGPFASRKCAEQYLQTYVAMAKILNGSEVMNLTVEAGPITASGNGIQSKTTNWVLDPYHRRFGVAA